MSKKDTELLGKKGVLEINIDELDVPVRLIHGKKELIITPKELEYLFLFLEASDYYE